MHTNKLELLQLKNGYRYNSDSLFLYNFVAKFLKKSKVLDVGCGCGILGLLIKRDYEFCDVCLLDLQEENIHLCEQNAKNNHLHVNIVHCDFLNFDKNMYDVVVSNPPFYHQGAKKSDNEHKCISKSCEYLPFKEFALKAHKVLKASGEFIFCYDSKQIQMIFSVLNECGFNVQHVRFVYPKINKSSSLVLVKAQKNSKSLCEILPILIANDENGYTSEAKNIFLKANLVSKDV